MELKLRRRRAVASCTSILARNHPDSFGFLDRRHAIMLRWIYLSLVVVALAALATFALQYRSISGRNGYLPVRAKVRRARAQGRAGRESHA